MLKEINKKKWKLPYPEVAIMVGKSKYIRFFVKNIAKYSRIMRWQKKVAAGGASGAF